MGANASNGIPVLLFIVMGVLLIANFAWFFSRSRSVLEQWAEANGYEILHSVQESFPGAVFLDEFPGADSLLR